MSKNETGASFLLLALAAIGAPAAAQSDQDEIVVTAQKREQALRDVPMAVTPFNADELARLGAVTPDDLVAFSPGLSGASVSATTPRITVRGVSTEDFGVGSDPALGIYVDEVYQGRNVGALSDLLDVSRVEVIRGPQGSLFGRNTTAGAVSITTNRPSQDFEARLEAEAEDYDGRIVRGVINGAFAPRLSGRAALAYRARDGWLDNQAGGDFFDIETLSGRLGLRLETDTFDGAFTIEGQSVDNGPQGYRSPIFGPADAFGAPISDLGEGGYDRIDKLQATLRLEFALGGLDLVSITSARESDNQYLEDTDAGPFKLLHFGTDGEDRAFSQDVRLAGAGDRFSWFIGAGYYFNDARSTQFALASEEDFCLVLFGLDCATAIGSAGDTNLIERSIGQTETTSYSLFGDVEWRTTDRLTMTAGLRYARDEKDFSVDIPGGANVLGTLFITPTAGRVDQSESWDALQPRLAITYALTDRINLYASAARGYKSGGFNQINPGPAFDPESMWSYELGLKGDVADGRMQFEVAAFQFDYSDLQVLVNEGANVVTRNAGAATGQGVEASLRLLPMEGLTLGLNVSLLDATYDRFVASMSQDYSGARLNRAPRTAASFVVDYTRPVGADAELALRAQYGWRSKTFFRPDNSDFASQDAYGLLDLSAGLTWRDRYSFTLFADNVLDEDYLVDAQIAAPGLLEYTQRGAPRIVGARFSAAFE